MALRPRRIWKDLVASLLPGHFQPSDYPLLRAYCEAEALHFEASRKIDAEGAVIERKALKKGRGGDPDEVIIVGVKANPWVAIQTQTAHTMAQLATKLRLATNSRLGPGEAGGSGRPKSKRAGLLFGEEEWPPP
jgi:phage terminase small subunit